jgi:Flp pilus assembly protein TadG
VSEQGSELVELMLVTPILLMLLAGIFDFGMLFRSWEIVTNAAREGARVGSLPGYAAEDVRARVEQYMKASGAANSCTLQTPAGGSCPSSDCSVCVIDRTDVPGPGVTKFSARAVTVVSRQTMPTLSWVTAIVGGTFGTVNVGSTSQMRTESPMVTGP